MAEEFQAGICGDTWWNNINSTRSVFPHMNSPSTCSVAANDAGNYNNNNTWQTTRVPFADEETNNNKFVSDHTSSLAFLDVHKPQQNESTAAGSSFLIDSTLQIMGFGCLSSPTSSNWSHSLFGRGESNFDSVVEEESAGIDSCNNSQKDWNTKNFSAASGSTTVDTFSTGNCGFPTSYGTNYPSNLIQNLYEPAADPQPQQQNSSSSVLFTNPYNNSSSSATATATASYENEVVVSLSPTWSKVVSSNSLMIKPSLMPKQQQQLSGLQFSNNTPFWNIASADQVLNDNIRAGSILASPQPVQYHHHHHQSTNSEDKKHNSPSSTLNKLKREESPDKKNSSESVVMKRPRIETPSSLPTFKVRKEKLGDRITALQQLVSPFGKTDTASVLHEAIEYIKFLHDQVNVLGSPYMKNGASIQNHHHHQQEDCDNGKESSSSVELEDLKSRGLCLVPISSTFPVTHETPVDFWTPTFGGPLFGR